MLLVEPTANARCRAVVTPCTTRWLSIASTVAALAAAAAAPATATVATGVRVADANNTELRDCAWPSNTMNFG